MANPSLLTGLTTTGGLGASIASSLYGADQATKQVQMTNEANLQAVENTNVANRQLAEYKFQKDLEMWNKENVYNSPSAQMQRFKDAGLNPNLIYGKGTSGNTSTSVRYSPPNVQAPIFDYRNPQANALRQQAIMQATQVGKLFAETDLIKKQAQVAQAQANNISADTELKHINTTIKKIEESFKSDTLQAVLNNLNADAKSKTITLETQRAQQYADLGRTILEMDKLDAQTKQIQIDNLYQLRTLEQRVLSAYLSNDLKEQQKALNELTKKYKEYENQYAQSGIRIGEQNALTGSLKFAAHHSIRGAKTVGEKLKQAWRWYDLQVGKGVNKVKGWINKGEK